MRIMMLTQDEVDKEESDRLLEEFHKEVKNSLEKTDLVALRCFKAGIPLPKEWAEYVSILRELLKSPAIKDIPIQPNYPEGT